MAVDQELDRLIYAAIKNKHLLQFGYKSKERIVEPHDYGVQNGVARLFSWQVGGHSSGRIPGWRLFDVTDIQSCKMLDRQFDGNRDVPSGKHHRWDRVFIRVEPPEKHGNE
jgi:predicted DNA-binding transcriptional regulator YafY